MNYEKSLAISVMKRHLKENRNLVDKVAFLFKVLQSSANFQGLTLSKKFGNI